MKRRQVLQAAVALPLLAGCSSRQAAPIQGAIVGASHRVGHLLREGKLGAVSRTTRVNTAILGGGIAGLSAAWKLAGSGWDDFCVYELEPEVGGNSRAVRYGPDLHAPWAAHYLPLPTDESRAVKEILTEMGLLRDGVYDEEWICHDPEERLYAFGAWEEGLYPRFGASQADLRQYEEFLHHIETWKKWRDSAGRKAFALPVHFSSPATRHLDSMSMAAYMDSHGWKSPRLRWFVEYGCRDDYGTSLEGTSAWAGLHYFASRDAGDQQFVWPEGNARLTRHLMKSVGDRHRTGCLVANVQQTPDGVRTLLLDVASGQVEAVESRYCIFALPSFLRAFVGLGPVEGFSYSPWVVANVLVDRPPDKAAWDNVIYESPSLGYVVSTHQSLSRIPSPAVLTWYRPFTGLDPAAERRKLLEVPWEGWRDQVLSELMALHKDLRVERLDVMLLGHAMVRPTPGFLNRRAALESDRIFFGHSDLSGISVFEEANFQGIRAAQSLMKKADHPYRDSLGAG